MRKMRIIRGICWTFVVFITGAFLCAGSTMAEQGVTNEQILIGSTADLSGPAAFMGKGVTDGARMYFDYINEQGGVHGRKIRLLVEDDGYQSPRALMGARKLVTRDGVFSMFLVFGGAQSNAMYPFLESQGVPLVAPGTAARDLAIPPRKYLFLADPTSTTLGTLAIEYFVEQMGMDAKTIACIYQDDTPGHDWLRGIKIGADHFGINVLELPYRRGAVDFSPHVARAKGADITHIFIMTLVREPALILKEAQRQQYKATFITSYASMSKVVLDLAGDSVDFSNGFYGVGTVFNPDSSSAAMRKYIDLAAASGLDPLNPLHCYGYVNAMILHEGLKRAGSNLTREGLITALESFDSFESGINPPVTWGPDIRDGSKAGGIGKAIDGVWKSLLPEGEWLYSKIDDIHDNR